MSFHLLTPEQSLLYERDGYVVIKGLCSSEEIGKLYAAALADNAMKNNALDLNDQTGKKTRLSLWFTPGDDVFGYFARSRRVIDTV